MRRMWAAGAAAAMCLALGALPAVARSPSASPTTQAEYAAVTGTSDCHDVTTPGEQQFAAPPYTLTDQVMACTKTASDPRVSGRATTVLNISSWDPAVVATATAWGDEEITGPDGTWTGRFYGIYDREGVLHLVHATVGSGAYKGWTYTYSSTVPAGSLTATTTGLLYHGPPPPGVPVEPLALPSPTTTQ
jgi:hypothetical protein